MCVHVYVYVHVCVVCGWVRLWVFVYDVAGPFQELCLPITVESLTVLKPSVSVYMCMCGCGCACVCLWVYVCMVYV